MKKIIVEKDGKPAGEIDYQDGCRIEGVCKELDIAVDEVMIGKLDNEILSYDVVPGEGVLNLVTIHSWEGSSIRMNTTLFVMLKAFHNCFNGRYKIVVEHSIGDGVYCEVFGAKLFTMDELDILLSEMITIVNDALHIEKKIYSSYESFKLFAELKRKDVLPLLYEGDNVVYECGDFYELVYAQVANTTSAAKVFDLFYHSPGFILRYPLQGSMRLREEFQFPKKLFSAHQEHDKWLNIIKLHTIKTLNSSVKNCNIREKIQIEEALQERKLVKIADEIVANRNLKLILIAGPSSSGKTTFSKRLAIHLIVNGIKPLQISLDDYFLPHDRTPLLENGEYDFENIMAIDLERLNNDLTALMEGKTITLPKYVFKTGERRSSGKSISMDENDLLVIEGIHGLNDLLTQSIPFHHKSKIYVSALNNLNIDDHNRISTTDCRRIRRLVRDHKFRGINPETTLLRWDEIREGEKKYIFPYQENADYMFNSILTYELGVLRYFARPLLEQIEHSSTVYTEAQRLLRILDLISSINPNIVPGNSIIREFIGGSAFDY
jgi:uridine kinase